MVSEHRHVGLRVGMRATADRAVPASPIISMSSSDSRGAATPRHTTLLLTAHRGYCELETATQC